MFEITCKVCQDTFETDNEDEMVSGICQDCLEFGNDWDSNYAEAEAYRELQASMYDYGDCY